MARPKKALTGSKPILHATEKKIKQTHTSLAEKKLNPKTRTLEPDPWTGKQKTSKANNGKCN